jgi:Tfp pilus assembly protein PilO
MKSIEQRQAVQTLAITKASAESEQLPALRERLLKLQRVVGNYQRQVPDRRELGVFLQQITNLMNEQNLKEQVIAPGKEIRTEKLSCIPVSMQCKGKLNQIFEFYKRLRKMDRLVRIEQIELVNEGGFNGEVSMQTKANIYYSAENVEG